LEMSTREMWAPIISSMNMICCKNCNEGEDSQGLYSNRMIICAGIPHDSQLHRCNRELIS
jgi:hypothetical protein